MAVFIWAASAVGGASAAEGVVICALLVVSISLDGVDGWVARRRGSDSSTGSYVDVLCDRVTEDAGWIFLATQNKTWGAIVAVLMLRNSAVDVVKAASSFAGHDLEIGVHVTGWRLAVVSSRASRVAHNALKALTLVSGVLAALLDWTATGAVAAVLICFLGFSLVRGAASLAQFPQTLREGRVAEPARLWGGFVAQAILALLTLGAVLVVFFS